MALQLKDRVLETASAPGTGSVTLLGASLGYQSFNTAITSGSTVYYTIADQGGPNWEVGVGTFTPTATLSRDTVLSSSAGGTTKVNFSSGTQNVWVDYPAEKAVIVNDVGDVLLNQSYDQGTGVLQVTGQSTFNGAVTDKSLNLQGGNNLVLNSATLVTQNITVTANTYTLSMTGTGTITLSGTSSGTLVGTGASTVVSKTFTPTAGTLTLTPTGSCTTVQLELGSVFSGYTATGGTAVTTTNNISVPSGQVLATTNGSNTAPPIAFGASGLGLYQLYTNGIGFASGSGVTAGALDANGFVVTGAYNWGASLTVKDLSLYRDAANTLAQRNSTNAQTFRLYNTYTDASNYERLSIDWSTTANTATISTQNAGTGSARNLAIGQDLYVNSVRVGLGGGSVSTNTVVGTGNCLINNTTGSYNTAVGNGVLVSNTTGLGNNAQGFNSLNSNTTGQYNSAIGGSSLQSNTTGSNSVAIGYLSLYRNTIASTLTAIGTSALQNNTTNVATLGTVTGGTGYTNGTYTGVVMTLSSGSSAITYPTATIVVSGGAVTTVTITSAGVGFKDTTTVLTAPAASIGGTGSGFSVPVATLASGTNNVAVGYQAGYTNSVGINNVCIGYQAGYTNSIKSNNTYVGYIAGTLHTGDYTTVVGQSALSSSSTGAQISTVGAQSLKNNSSGSNLSSFGVNSLFANSTGSNNTAFGHSAGYGNASANANTTGSNNTYIGYQTVGSGVANTNEMVIGYQAVGLGSNTTVIGNSSTTSTTVFGQLNAPIVNASNGLHVNSNTVSASYTIPSGSSASSVGPMTLGSGVSVTVPPGSRWVVL